MYISAIARVYWRTIKGGFRTYVSVVGADKKEQVKYLANEDVKNKIITPEKYLELIGEEYVSSQA